MIYGHLKSDTTLRAFAQSAPHVWQKAIDCLAELDGNSELGIKHLIDTRMYVNVHRYVTKPAQDCNFESHRHTVDLQFIIEGGECIDWALTSDALQPSNYDDDSDFQLYYKPDFHQCTRLHLPAGFFALFFPCDAHRPMIHDGAHDGVLKAVVKVDTSLLANSNG